MFWNEEVMENGKGFGVKSALKRRNTREVDAFSLVQQ
jgi:hypothetical protein